MNKALFSKTTFTNALLIAFFGVGMLLGKIGTTEGIAGITLASQNIFQRMATQKAIDGAGK